jgi:hypothetical protein
LVIGTFSTLSKYSSGIPGVLNFHIYFHHLFQLLN